MERAIVLAGAEATARAGAALAALVRGGDAIALVGDLGAGKTTLVAGLARALGAGAAASPTFALVHEYRGGDVIGAAEPERGGDVIGAAEPERGGDVIVWHVDLYRIEREAELVELGLDEILGDPRGVCLVEWADRFAVMPPDHLRLELAHAAASAGPAGGGDHRILTAGGTGPRGEALARDLAAALLASP